MLGLSFQLRKKLSLVFAGHDHKQEFAQIGRTQIIDSGAHFNFSQVILDDKGKVIFSQFFDEHSQSVLASLVKQNSLEADLIQKTVEFLRTRKNTASQQFKPAVVSLNVPRKQYPSVIEQTRRLAEQNHKPRCIKMFQGK